MIAKFVAGPPYQSPGIGATMTWRFTPASRNYASVTGNITGEDYLALLMGEVSGNWTNTGAQLSKHTGPERGISVALPKLTTHAADGLIVPIEIQNAANKGIIAYQFDLKYDPSVIRPDAIPVDLRTTASRGLSAVVNAHEPGLLRVVVYGATTLDANGILLYLRFNAVGLPGAWSPITLEKIMFNEADFGTLVTDGQIRLSEAAAPLKYRRPRYN